MRADDSDSLAYRPILGEHATRLTTPELEAAVGIARASLKTLGRYRDWKARGERYDTWVELEVSGHVTVAFGPPCTVDQSVSVEVDLVTRSVVHVMFGRA